MQSRVSQSKQAIVRAKVWTEVEPMTAAVCPKMRHLSFVEHGLVVPCRGVWGAIRVVEFSWGIILWQNPVGRCPAARRKPTVLRKNSVLVRSLTDPRDKPSAQSLYIHRCLKGAVVIVGFEFVPEMNLVQIGINEFFPQLDHLAANEKHRQSRPYSPPEIGETYSKRSVL